MSFPLRGGRAKRRGGKKRARPVGHGSQGRTGKQPPRPGRARATAASGALSPVRVPSDVSVPPRKPTRQGEQARARTTTAGNRAGRAGARQQRGSAGHGSQTRVPKTGVRRGRPSPGKTRHPSLPPVIIHTVAQSIRCTASGQQQRRRRKGALRKQQANRQKGRAGVSR